MPRGPLLCNGVRKVRAKTGKPNAKGWLSPPYRLPLGIPVKNSFKRARYDGKRELPLPIVPLVISFCLSPASLRHKED